jgi:hypothetical protein
LANLEIFKGTWKAFATSKGLGIAKWFRTSGQNFLRISLTHLLLQNKHISSPYCKFFPLFQKKKYFLGKRKRRQAFVGLPLPFRLSATNPTSSKIPLHSWVTFG